MEHTPLLSLQCFYKKWFSESHQDRKAWTVKKKNIVKDTNSSSLLNTNVFLFVFPSWKYPTTLCPEIKIKNIFLQGLLPFPDQSQIK